MDNPFDAATPAYARVRPAYPGRILDRVLAVLPAGARRAVDLGAGTGKMTGMLLARGLDVVAVEPSAAMRDQLRLRMGQAGGSALVDRGAGARTSPRPTSAARPATGTRPTPADEGAHLRVLAARAEGTGLPAASQDLVVSAQAWHWFDEPAAGAEVHRILRPGGVLAIVWNQMDVAVPWVHRLTRIMRSGDVHRPDRPPHPGSGFAGPELTQVEWTDTMTPEELLELGTTRSSYLRSDPTQRRRMQDNLRWYLLDHRHLTPGVPVEIPYTTLLWTARRLPQAQQETRAP